jgi:predicted dehydrogenase
MKLINKSVILIGYGRWGKIIYQKLEKICKNIKICTSKNDYKQLIKSENIDWVVVATNTSTHYKIVEFCLLNKKNVFCEKPLTLSYCESKKLYNIAERNKVKLYVSDVFNYRKDIREKIENIDKKMPVNVTWQKDISMWKSDSYNFVFNLMYHDIYILHFLFNKNINVDWPKVNNVLFSYNRGKSKVHMINDFSLLHEKNSNDALSDMFVALFNNNVDFVYNKKITLKTNRIIEKIIEVLTDEQKNAYK